MPQLIVGFFLLEGFAAFAVYAGFYAAVFAYSTYQANAAKRAANANYNASLKDRLVSTATTDAPRSRSYGRARNVDGIVYKATHGVNSEFYTFVVAITGHEIDGFEDLYFDDSQLLIDSSGYVLSAPYAIPKVSTGNADTGSNAASGSYTIALPSGLGVLLVAGSVSVMGDSGGSADTRQTNSCAFTQSGPDNLTINWSGNGGGYDVSVSWQYLTPTPKARIRTYTGAPGQDLSVPLIALGIPGITSAMKFQGFACLLVTLTFDVDAYPSGVPSFSATYRGAKILDRRTGITAWTQNPAVIADDWAQYVYGGACASSEVVESSVIASANDCDVTHAFVGTLNTVTRPLYTCNIVCPTQTDPTASLNEIVASMAGKYAWTGGRLRLKAGAYHAPVATIDETWLSGIGSIDIQSGLSRANLINIYRPTISNEAQHYIVQPAPEVDATTYIALDGGPYPRDVTFLAITDTDHSSHVAAVLIRDARQGLTVKMPCNMQAYPIDVFDTVYLNLARFGFANKIFEVLNWEFSPRSGVILTMKATGAAIFVPDNLFPDLSDQDNSNLPSPWLVPTPTNLVLTSGASAMSDGSIISRMEANWDILQLATVIQSGTFELQYILITDLILNKDWISHTVDGTQQRDVIVGVLANRGYIARVRAINAIGVKSQWSIQKAIIIAPLPSISVDWTNLSGKPLLFRVRSTSRLRAGNCDLSNGETGAILAIANPRSYMVVRIRRSDGVLTFVQNYDVYASGALSSGRDASTMAADLNATTSDYIVVVISVNEPKNLRLSGGLDVAMYRCGASRAVYGSPQFMFGSAYVMIGIGGCGEGNGFESYAGAVPDDPAAFVDVAFELRGGNLIVTGSGSSGNSLADYGYIGTLDATTDVSLIGRVNCVVAGNFVTKVGGTTSWDSDAYSRDSFTGGAYASARANQTNMDVMFGLNTDPTTDASYTSIDCAIYFTATGTILIYESGVGIGSYGAYNTTDVFTIFYDGYRITYYKNGIALRTILAMPGLVLSFDSSFATPGSALSNIRFGPASAVVGIGTEQLAAGAATDSLIVVGGFGTMNSGSGGGFGGPPATAGDVTLVVDTLTYTNTSLGTIPVEISASLINCSRGPWNSQPPITTVTLDVTIGGTLTTYIVGQMIGDGVNYPPSSLNISTLASLPSGAVLTADFKVRNQNSAKGVAAWSNSILRFAGLKR